MLPTFHLGLIFGNNLFVLLDFRLRWHVGESAFCNPRAGIGVSVATMQRLPFLQSSPDSNDQMRIIDTTSEIKRSWNSGEAGALPFKATSTYKRIMSCVSVTTPLQPHTPRSIEKQLTFPSTCQWNKPLQQLLRFSCCTTLSTMLSLSIPISLYLSFPPKFNAAAGKAEWKSTWDSSPNLPLPSSLLFMDDLRFVWVNSCKPWACNVRVAVHSQMKLVLVIRI